MRGWGMCLAVCWSTARERGRGKRYVPKRMTLSEEVLLRAWFLLASENPRESGNICILCPQDSAVRVEQYARVSIIERISTCR